MAVCCFSIASIVIDHIQKLPSTEFQVELGGGNLHAAFGMQLVCQQQQVSELLPV
jgi:hypothetical protein